MNQPRTRPHIYDNTDVPDTFAPKEKENKPDWSIFPFTELEEVLKVFEFGVKKYGKPFTYRQGNGVSKRDLFAATFRHLLEIHKGNLTAKDSHCYHWAHIVANGLMYLSHPEEKEKPTWP